MVRVSLGIVRLSELLMYSAGSTGIAGTIHVGKRTKYNESQYAYCQIFLQDYKVK